MKKATTKKPAARKSAKDERNGDAQITAWSTTQRLESGPGCFRL